MKIISASASASALALPLVLAKAENLRGVKATAVVGRALDQQFDESRKVVVNKIEDCVCDYYSPSSTGTARPRLASAPADSTLSLFPLPDPSTCYTRTHAAGTWFFLLSLVHRRRSPSPCFGSG